MAFVRFVRYFKLLKMTLTPPGGNGEVDKVRQIVTQATG